MATTTYENSVACKDASVQAFENHIVSNLVDGMLLIILTFIWLNIETSGAPSMARSM